MRSFPEHLAAVVASTFLLGASPGPRAETFAATLSGVSEIGVARPAGLTGDPDASGKVRIVIDELRSRICYDFQLSGISTPLMAHIHRGTELSIGPSVVTLFTGTGELRDCVPWTPKQLSAIVAEPANHYVNLYTFEFPDGAVRGQLG